MSVDDDLHAQERTWSRQAAPMLRFNSPLGNERALRLADWVADSADTVVDLGCGRGELLLLAAERHPALQCVGIDSNDELIRRATAEASSRGVAGRVSFVIADASAWTEPASVVCCIGAAHSLGGFEAAADRLTALCAGGRLVLGDGLWQASPTAWCRETFGPLPDQAAAIAAVERRGWRVVEADLSTREEWDRFESEWSRAVESIATGGARHFARRRRQEYQTHYRGVLGFGWLLAER
jgi:cyclopropane fatty-acyl-phospholipid synthase-like methyltransferase